MMGPRETIRLLVVEDSPGDARLIREMLSESGTDFDVTTAERLEDALVILKQGTFDTLLLDLNLPDSQGIETLNRIFAHVPETPIIVLTGLDDEMTGVRAISEGGQDYLVKGRIDPPLLVRAIQYARGRKKAERALQESEVRYKRLFDSTMDGIYQTDADARMVMINQAGAKIFGHQYPAEMIGKTVLSYWLDPAERDAFVAELRRSKSVRAYPVRAKNARGEIVYLETSSHVLEENGKFVGIEGILRDVTEHRRLEEQYRQAQKMEAVGQLAGGVAHDFNNILSAIMGYAHLSLMKLKEGDPIRHNLEQVLDSSQRAATLVQSLLAFSRKQVLNPLLLDVNDLLRKFEKFILRLLREDIEFTTLCSEGMLPVMADNGQLEQAVMNLVANARDAMPHGGRLEIETSRVTLDKEFSATHGYGGAGDFACISVTDTGTGMDEITKKHVFEPFFTTKELGKGTGLGLSMVYGIVKKHEGYINVYSELGKGTTFKIYLPIAHAAAPPVERVVLKAPPALEGSETILLAEDDEAVRNLTMNVLEHFGYTVITANDGEEAVARFLEHRTGIALAVLDGIMPKKNGREVYEELRAVRPDIKALFMSGYPEDAVGRKGILDPGTNFISKPFAPSELVKRVREILDRDKKR